MSKTYTCYVCKQQFVSAWTDEEALAEKRARWPDVPDADCEVVCDECNKRLVAWMKATGQWPAEDGR